MKIIEHKPKVAQLYEREPPKPKTYPKILKDHTPELPDFVPVDDPLADIPDTGSVQRNARAELDALQTAFYRRRDRTSVRSLANADTEYWFAAVFETRAQKEAFLRAVGLYDKADKYVDGRDLAEVMDIALPASDIDWNPRQGNRTRRNEGAK